MQVGLSAETEELITEYAANSLTCVAALQYPQALTSEDIPVAAPQNFATQPSSWAELRPLLVETLNLNGNRFIKDLMIQAKIDLLQKADTSDGLY